MPRTKNYEALRRRLLERPGAAERIEAQRKQALEEIGLFELRRSQDVSQVELASRLEITQSAVSKVENAEDVRLSTLRDYVEALGGRLRIEAEFPDRTVALDVGSRGEVA